MTSVLNPVHDINTAVLERPALNQLQVDLTAHRVEQRDTGSEEHRVDVEADLIDQPRLEERPGQITASHQADAPSVLPLQVTDELGRLPPDDGDSAVRALFE